MPPAGFEHVIPASDRPQTLPLDRLARTVQRVSSRYTDYAIPIHLGVMMGPISCLEKSLANYQSFFLSLFLSSTSVYLIKLGVEGYYSFDHIQ